MRKILLALGVVIVAGLAVGLQPDRAMAAESVVVKPRAVAPRVIEKPIVESTCRAVWRCGPWGCDWRRVCPNRCPDRMSCYPLYGAYGPYGGLGYWGGYTDTGWGPR